ncbi:MAG: MBL fold metallo-hydrolase [Myxococcales bacterium]|nr:MBL fold metallo-hydrolase [Myxococcales bacterium]
MAKRQEQEAARSEVTEVGPGVLRMELPIHMPGLGHVNCYALLDDDGAALVDPGLPGPFSWRALKDRLRRAGLRVRNIHTVVVTHSHADHFGGATRLAREAGAEIVAHRSFRFGVSEAAHPEVSAEDLAASREDAPSGGALHGRQLRDPRDVWDRPAPWGGAPPRPTWKTRLKWAAFSAFRGSIVPPISRPVEAGQVIRLAKREWFAVHTPGHTEDHICLHDPAEGVFLSGDHVLPTITPHISGLALAADPLHAFFESLEQVAVLPHVGDVLPAHGHPFRDLAARARAIREHHIERLARVEAIGRALGPATVSAFSRELFRKKVWGSMAESETYAHLEHLRHTQKASRREGSAGELIYETG